MIENSFDDWVGWFVAIIVFIKLITFVLQIWVQNKKTHDRFEKDNQKLKDFYEKLLTEKLRQAHAKNNSKWLQLDRNSKDKILKVKTMSERGEGGERHAAKNRLDALLLKNNLVLSDIPAYEV